MEEPGAAERAALVQAALRAQAAARAQEQALAAQAEALLLEAQLAARLGLAARAAGPARRAFSAWLRRGTAMVDPATAHLLGTGPAMAPQVRPDQWGSARPG